jgi:hypothetical protein
MWMAVVGSIIVIGLSLAAIYFAYLKMNHPLLIFSAKKRVEDFIMDSYAALIQYDRSVCFHHKPSLASGDCPSLP